MKIRLWAVSDGTSLGVILGHTGAVTALAFAPDGRTLISGSTDATIRLWDVTSKQILKKTLEGHLAAVQGLAFAPDGKSFASASRDKSVRLWDVATGREVRPLGSHDANACCVAFSPDGKTVASGGLDRMVRFWGVVDEPQPKPQKPSQQPQPTTSRPSVRRRSHGDRFCTRRQNLGDGSGRPAVNAIGFRKCRNSRRPKTADYHRSTSGPPGRSPDSRVFPRRQDACLRRQRSLDPALECEGWNVATGDLARPLSARTRE